MNVHLAVRNESQRKQCYRRAELVQLATRMCMAEAVAHDVELSLLFCDDPFIQQLNRLYRHKNCPTDVLSFGQTLRRGRRAKMDSLQTPLVLGDIVISLETVERHCSGDRAAMRGETRLLFCHGLLHLLGYTHDTERKRARMATKQAEYLGLDVAAAWPNRPEGV